MHMVCFRPDNFMLLPTEACQASCRYCFAGKTGRVMDHATALAALDFIARTAPERNDFHLTFHGGEPLLAGEDFYVFILPEIIARFGRRVHLSVQSNLWAMTDSLAELFARYRVSVGTSIDGPRDMCDAQRGYGYYDKTIAGLELLKKHGVSVGIICTFTAESSDRAAEVFAGSRTPYSIHGAVPTLGSDDRPGAVSSDQMARILLDSYDAYKRDPAHCRITTIDAMAKGSFNETGMTCTFFDCLGSFAAIDPEGDVYTCQRFCGKKEFSVGNVSCLTEEIILNSPAYSRLRSVQDGKRQACSGCSHWEYCMGGCLYSTLTGGGSKDPYCDAYSRVFDRMRHDLALEMSSAMLGRDVPMPVLAMAGDRQHPYDMRQSRQRMRLALERGSSPDGFGESLRSRWPENDLNKLYLHLTFDCPLRCSHCYAEGGTAYCPELTPAGFANIVCEAANRRFHSVVITGGEPLVYKGFDEMCRLLTAADLKGTKLILRTSLAFPVSGERLSAICRLFDEIIVSVDGDRDSHDRRRGAGRYDLTVFNLEKAAAMGAAEKIGLTATLTRTEAHGPEGESVRSLAVRLGISKVRFRPVLPLGRAADTKPEMWQLCAEEMEYDPQFRPRHTCGLGQNLYVQPDGGTFPCYAWCSPNKKLGDLSAESLGSLLDRGGLYEYTRHDVDTNEKCCKCEVRYLCGGICKAWAGDKDNVDSGDFDCSDRESHYRRLRLLQRTESRGTCGERVLSNDK